MWLFARAASQVFCVLLHCVFLGDGHRLHSSMRPQWHAALANPQTFKLDANGSLRAIRDADHMKALAGALWTSSLRPVSRTLGNRRLRPRHAVISMQSQSARLSDALRKERSVAGANNISIPLSIGTFNLKDDVHGLIMLPSVLKKFVDHRYFQRLRHIRQLSMCSHVYPGACQSRFSHSLGTAHLAHVMIKGIKERQPELEISNKDVLSVSLAALLHDLGHPCFSHMFEDYVHRVGKTKENLTDAQRQRYANFAHEDVSVALVRLMWEEFKPDLEALGLTDSDLEFVCAMVNPPAKKLNSAMDDGRLGEEWSNLVPFVPKRKSWMLEIVSNWRSGLDVDRFDYFRRDARSLGIVREFDHDRYMQTVLVAYDQVNGVWTISPPDKDKDFLREDMLELRRSLHRSAYQHKTVQKLTYHMIEILELMDKSGVKVIASEGNKVSMSEAAVEFDAFAYVQLTDSFVESRLFEAHGPYSRYRPAYEEYERRILHRQMYKLLADFDVPPAMDLSVHTPEQIIQNMLETYHSLHASGKMNEVVPPRANEEPCGEMDLDPSLFRCSISEFHQGMKRKDPLLRVLFHSSKDPSQTDFLQSEVVPPLTQKVFIFHDAAEVCQPGSPSFCGPEGFSSLVFRQLVASFLHWARSDERNLATDTLRSFLARAQHQDGESSPIRVSVEQARIQHSP